MKLHIYQGETNVPKDVTHVIVHESVTAIKEGAFHTCRYLVSIIMGDNVKRIERYAFYCCIALRFIRLSKTLEHIGEQAFLRCSLEALFLPSTLKSIEDYAFISCRSLRLLVLPHGINLSNGNVGNAIIWNTGIEHIAQTAAGVTYERRNNNATDESNHTMNEWLVHHMDEFPFHKLCYSPSVTTKQINDYIIDNGKDSALAIDPIHLVTPLHILSMNPNAPADAIATLSNSNMEALFCADNQQKSPLEYARDYNVRGLLGMINSLCTHRNSSMTVVVKSSDANIENTS
jgi:hypothetical protein